MSEAGPIGPFGELLSPAERRQFVGFARQASYDRGDVLFHQGDVTRHAVLIESGSVKIVVRRPDGADMLLAVRGPNDLVGGPPRSG